MTKTVEDVARKGLLNLLRKRFVQKEAAAEELRKAEGETLSKRKQKSTKDGKPPY